MMKGEKRGEELMGYRCVDLLNGMDWDRLGLD